MSPTHTFGNFEKLYILIEVFFDDAGKMHSWTLHEKERRYEPMGETQDELIEDLELKLRDAKKWKAVEYDKIEIGMKFERTGDDDRTDNV